MIKHVIWASMIDYPKHTSSVLFTGDCNFNCSYCYNKTLKNQPNKDFDKDILPKLIERKDFIDHVIISGGEPTIDSKFNYMIDELYGNGFVIGIHTNGSNPEKIKEKLDKISFFGVDIKTSKEKYNSITGINFDTSKLEQTVELLTNSGKDCEFRTTLFPKDVEKQDVLKIAKWLKSKGVKSYHLQQYYPVNGAEEVTPYTEKEINELRDECNSIIPTILKTK